MTIPNQYVYWTGSAASDFPLYFTGLGPVVGSASIEYKPRTGSMINPSVRWIPSIDFYTSGAFAAAGTGSFSAWKLTSSLPARYRIYFDKIEHNFTSSVAGQAEFQWGFLFGANNITSQSQVNELCGWGLVFRRNDTTPSCRVFLIENGIARYLTSNPTTYGFGSSSFQHFTIDVSLNSLLGSITGGVYFDLWGYQMARSLRTNEDRRNHCIW
jgi:hypothetical protein